MNQPVENTLPDVLTEIRGNVGFITLNRPRALNALSLNMVRDLTRILLDWNADQNIKMIAIRGSSKDGVFNHFCAGGDIRSFYFWGLEKNPDLDAFFTEEYQLNYLTHYLDKPYITFLDGIVMGGGMGLSQGADIRIVTEKTKMAMPETLIGLFPDVGGGYFLSRCSGFIGEWLALTGSHLNGQDAVAVGLADYFLESTHQAQLWDLLGQNQKEPFSILLEFLKQNQKESNQLSSFTKEKRMKIDSIFSLPNLFLIQQALENNTKDEWSQNAAAEIKKRSPLMQHVTFEQIRRARNLSLADDLKMERILMYNCFHLHPAGKNDSLEGIRALVVDKDNQPRWQSPNLESVSLEMTRAFFKNPWSKNQNPLHHLGKRSS